MHNFILLSSNNQKHTNQNIKKKKKKSNIKKKKSPPNADSSLVDPIQRNDQVCKNCFVWKPMRAKHCS